MYLLVCTRANQVFSCCYEGGPISFSSQNTYHKHIIIFQLDTLKHINPQLQVYNPSSKKASVAAMTSSFDYNFCPASDISKFRNKTYKVDEIPVRSLFRKILLWLQRMCGQASRLWKDTFFFTIFSANQRQISSIIRIELCKTLALILRTGVDRCIPCK